MTFEEFVAARLPALLRQATVYAADRYEAEDAVQNVLLKVQARWPRIGALDVPEAYVRRMVVNELVSVRRQVTARLRREQAAPPGPEPDRADAVAEHDALVRLIRRLPPRQRIVIALRYVEDMADGDIAELLGISLGTVRSQAARALTTLRTVMTRDTSGPPGVSGPPGIGGPPGVSGPTGGSGPTPDRSARKTATPMVEER